MTQSPTTSQKVLSLGGFSLLFLWMIINLGWKMALFLDASNPPIPEDTIPWLISAIIATLIYLITIRSQTVNHFLLLPLGLWGIQFLYALIFRCPPYEILMDGIGFSSTLACFLHIQLKLTKEDTYKQKEAQ